MKIFMLSSMMFAALLSAQTQIAPIDINDWVYWQICAGFSTRGPNHFENSFFPMDKATVIWGDYTPWSGIVRDPRSGAIPLRAGGSYYSNGTQPGWVVTPGTLENDPVPVDRHNSRAHIYRVRKDFDTAPDDSLIHDAAVTFNLPDSEVTADLIETLRTNYKRDWQEWPVDLGAPWYDRDRDGQWNPEVDEPGIAGADQVIWYVVNDLSKARTKQLFGSPPMGLEVQATVWAYKNQPHVGGQAIYKRYRLINKSAFPIDSMYFGQFSETDIGDYADDFVGCDSVWQMGYAYNSPEPDKIFEALKMPSPAVAYILLQGPVVKKQGAQALQGFQATEDYENLKMTSFWFHATAIGLPQPELGDYEQGTVFINALLQGYAGLNWNDTRPFYHSYWQYPPSGAPTKYPLNGDPVSLAGDVEGGWYAGNRNLMINTGPFSMQPGEMQEIVIGVLGGYGIENTRNALAVFDLQQKAPYVHWLYQDMANFEAPMGQRDTTRFIEPYIGPSHFYLGQNYPNPFNGGTHFKIDIPREMPVDLAVYNMLGQRVKTIFQGTLAQNVYPFEWQGQNSFGTKVSGGLYFIRLSGAGLTRVRKTVYLP